MNIKSVLFIFFELSFICLPINSQELLGRYSNEIETLDFKSNGVVEFKLNSRTDYAVNYDYRGMGNYSIANETLKIDLLQLPNIQSNIELLGRRLSMDSLTISVYDKESGKVFRGMANMVLRKDGRIVAHRILFNESVQFPINKISTGMVLELSNIPFPVFNHPITDLNSDLIIRYSSIPSFENTKKFLYNNGCGFDTKLVGDTIFLKRERIGPINFSSHSGMYYWIEFIKEKKK